MKFPEPLPSGHACPWEDGPDMADSGGELHPAHVYAFEKCGFLVTDTNRHLFDDDDLAEWDAAIAEWEPPTHHDEA